MKLICALLLVVTVLTVGASAQYPYHFSTPPAGPYILYRGFAPNSSTDVTTATSYVDQIWVANVTGTSATIRVSDKSTLCNNGVCNWVPSVTIAANTAYALVTGGGLVYQGGINIQSDTANAIAIQIRGRRAGQ
jgi:hypothetical protein